MSESLARAVVAAAAIYFAVGFLFAIPFVLAGAPRIDPGAKGASIAFRLLILPGSIALWPWLLARWVSGRREPPSERNAHRDLAGRSS